MRTLLRKSVIKKISGIFYDVYNELGYGLLERVYEESLVIALNDTGARPQFRRLVFDNQRKKIRGNPRRSWAGVPA